MTGSQHIPNRFPTTCITPDGHAFEGEGIPESGAAVALHFRSWGRTPMRVNNKPVTGLYFPIDLTPKESEDTSVLMGKADNGVAARLVRADPKAADAYGTPLEALLELKRGAYARSARSKGINSLEQLAALSDDAAAALGPGWVWRHDLARQFLEQRAGGSGRPAPVTNANVAPLKDESALETQAKPSLSTQALGLTGRWTRVYTCANLPIALELALQDLGDGSLWGKFAFSVSPESPSGLSGSFYLWGVKYDKSQQIELIAGPWVMQPPGYTTVNMAGSYTLEAREGTAHSTGQLKGRILLRGCKEFHAERVEESVVALGEMPEAIQAKLQGYGQSSDQSERSDVAPQDRNGADARNSTNGECMVEMIAGTYRSTFGDMTCKPGGSGLECCYGGADCQKMLHLELMENGRNLVGEWEHQGRRKGPAEFGLTESCELTDGRWRFAPSKVNNRWTVAGRK